MHILRCLECGKYTLKKQCPSCQGKTGNPHPPKFSPPDRYGKYRRMMKKEEDGG